MRLLGGGQRGAGQMLLFASHVVETRYRGQMLGHTRILNFTRRESHNH